eukprot:TRINITY_DN9959_c0_g1_i1.p1 TRINITY_DN9959_c0_g1~~TRINITY_DN9959_c0_g1_i1.p1  ORF type:complete len:627 (+),score=132.34 TRINITY_DN9959_c0_g1_i1:87-1967(+)
MVDRSMIKTIFFLVLSTIAVAQQIPSEGTPCNGVGREYYETRPSNVCHSSLCHPWKAICIDGTDLTFSPHVNNTIEPAYNGSINEDCNITWIRCLLPEYSNAVYIDLENQFNATNCKIEAMTYGMYVQPVENATNAELFQSNGIHTQYYCESNWKRYGFLGLDYYCFQEEVWCDGIKMDMLSPNSTINQQNISTCITEEKPCTLDEVLGYCRRYDIFCKNEEREGCQQDFIEFPCNGSTSYINTSLHHLPGCIPTRMNCGGNVISIDDWSFSVYGALSNCSVIELNCANTTRNLDEFSSCHLESMTCYLRGHYLPYFANNFTGNFMENYCAVDKLKCAGQEGTCTFVKPICENQNRDCMINSWNFPCQNNRDCLNIPTNLSVCTCPLDRKGSDCGNSLQLECTATRSQPSQCNVDQPTTAPEVYLDSDWPCLEFSMNSQVEIGFQVECHFTEPMANYTERVAEANFTYFIDMDNFKMSLPEYWNVTLKFFNFFRLSDDSQVSTLTLTKEQMMGQDSFWINSTLSQFSSEFWAGNRLFLEVSWKQLEGPPGNSQDALLDLFIDSSDRPVPTQSISVQRMDETRIFIIALASLIGIGIVGVGVRRCFHSKKSSKKYTQVSTHSDEDLK